MQTESAERISPPGALLAAEPFGGNGSVTSDSLSCLRHNRLFWTSFRNRTRETGASVDRDSAAAGYVECLIGNTRVALNGPSHVDAVTARFRDAEELDVERRRLAVGAQIIVVPRKVWAASNPAARSE
jgi:hypothetical protein